MAEFVQQTIEEMVGELHEMQTAGLFDGSEIRYTRETLHTWGYRSRTQWLTGYFYGEKNKDAALSLRTIYHT